MTRVSGIKAAGGLEDLLLAAHARRDTDALADLYRQAADLQEADGDLDAACFYLTQALVFALHAGSPIESELRARLHAYGRDSAE